MKDVRRYQLIALVAAVLALTVAFVRPKESKAPTNTNTANVNATTNANQPVSNTNSVTNFNLDTDRFFAADLPDADPAFNFSMLLGSGWTAEYDAATKSIMISDPHVASANKLKVKISYYRGTQFADPSGTVVPDTIDAAPLHDDNGPIVREVQVTTKAQIPAWGDQTHWEVDIEVPAVQGLYYRFDFAPDISIDTVAKLINSIDFGGSER